MTTPEKSVEEIVEELNSDFMAIIKEFAPNWYAHLVDSDENKGEAFRKKLTQTIQTERQKRDEAVEAERERIYEALDNYYDDKEQGYPNTTSFDELVTIKTMSDEIKALTQTNNHK